MEEEERRRAEENRRERNQKIKEKRRRNLTSTVSVQVNYRTNGMCGEGHIGVFKGSQVSQGGGLVFVTILLLKCIMTCVS